MAGNKNAEDAILDTLAKHTDDDFGADAGDDGADSGTESEAPSRSARNSSNSDDAGGELPSRRVPSKEQPGDNVQLPADGKGSQQQGKPAADGKVKPDAKGNLVDSNGNIVAQAGPERRVVERLRAHTDDLQRQIGELNKKFTDTQFLNDVPRRLGLSNDDVSTGLQLVADFSRDPVKVARDVLERALALGHNLTDILGEGASSVDMRGITRAIDERLRPLTQDRQQTQEATRQNEEGMRAYNKFMADFPEAETHQDAIANLMGRGMSAETALYRIRSFADANGLDFNEPLGPQIAARANGDQNPAPQVNGNQPARRQQAPMPNSGGGASLQPIASAPANASFEDIIRESMRDAGYR